MKKFNKNCILFAFFVIFVISGIWGKCFINLRSATEEFAVNMCHGNLGSFSDFRSKTSDLLMGNISYHNGMMTVNSIKENLLGTRIIKKGDDIVVKSDSGKLCGNGFKEAVTELQADEVIDKISELKDVCDKNNTPFLYCLIPGKECFETFPANIKNSSKEDYNLFVSKMNESDIPFLDILPKLRQNGIKDTDIHFNTDHHWKPYCGFVGTKILCEELNNRYGFEYKQEYTDINNFSVKTYKNHFLGSRGKKTGLYFSWLGADDFDLITPKFKTDFSEIRPATNSVRTGSFENSLLFNENMKKDYYNINAYATYSGGDFRCQIMKNNLNTNSKKILLIRDSFACVIAPFLALQTGELHICDVRNYAYYVGEKPNIEQYIKEIKPDYVIVTYYNVYSLDESNGKYDFF